MNVVVVGASGVLGRASLPALCSAGHSVRGSTTRGAALARIEALGAAAIVANLDDAAQIASLVRGADAVVNLATRIPPIGRMGRRAAWAENDRVRGPGTRRLVDAALSAGVPIFVQESVTFVYPDGASEWIDESSPIRAVPSYARSVLDAERETARFTDAGGRGIVLRFASLYGPDAPSSLETARLVRGRRFPIVGSGRAYYSSLHTDDAGSAIAAALGIPSGTYNVADDEPLMLGDYVSALARTLGAPAPLRVPAWLARVLAGESARLLTESRRVSNARLRSATGWAPEHRSARDGWQAVKDAWERSPSAGPTT